MTEELATAYGHLEAMATGLSEAESWQPTGCAGWSVRDLVFHLLTDAQRALVALAGPTPDGPCDRDAISYWTDAPGQEDPESRQLRATRTMASAFRLGALAATYVGTTGAVVALAGRVPPDARVATQGHVLTARDLVDTLVVEAAVHHLDLVAHLDRPGPGSAPLARVRHTLDGLLGRPVPLPWDDVTWARAGTGRRPLTADECVALGADAARLPLLH